MRKFLTLLGLVAALAIPTVALAASLNTDHFGDLIAAGDDCANGAFYHLVNVQSGGADDSTLDVTFSDASENLDNVSSYQSPGTTTHYLVFGTSELQSAVNALPGFIVISDVTCKKGKKG
jgi:hypothetical protein